MGCLSWAGAAWRWRAWDTFLGRKVAFPVQRGGALDSGAVSEEEAGDFPWVRLV